LVLESRVLSEEQEWRSFSNTESGSGGQDRSRVAGPNNVWIDSGVQGTAMMGGDKKHSRLMQTHEITTV
jgi:transcription initiation factor TFIIB